MRRRDFIRAASGLLVPAAMRGQILAPILASGDQFPISKTGLWAFWDFTNLGTAQSVPDLSGNTRPLQRGSASTADANDFGTTATAATFTTSQSGVLGSAGWNPDAFTIITVDNPLLDPGLTGSRTLLCANAGTGILVRRHPRSLIFYPNSGAGGITIANSVTGFECLCLQYDYTAQNGAVWFGGAKTAISDVRTKPTSSSQFQVGQYNASGYFEGAVAAMAVYTRILPDAEVQAAYAGLQSYLAAKNCMVNVPYAAGPATGTPTLPTVTCANAASPLTTDTYDGSGQVTHPSVVDCGVSGWNGHRYWMAITPYPTAQSAYENPSIYCSDDGNTWAAPVGLTNPVEARPGTGYNSDPRLVLVSGTMYLFFRQNTGGSNEGLWLRTSTDGVTWTDKTLVLYPSDGAAQIMSPSVVYRNGQWLMWTMSSTTGSLREFFMRSAPTPNGPWSVVGRCTFDQFAYPVTASWGLWHGNVIWNEARGRYCAVLMISSDTSASVSTAGRLFYAESLDGVKWSVTASPILTKSASAWDNGQIYQSSIVPTSASAYDLWYTGVSSGNAWHLGRTAITLS